MYFSEFNPNNRLDESKSITLSITLPANSSGKDSGS